MIVEFPHFSANLKKKELESKAHTVCSGVHNKHCYPTHLLALSAAPETFNSFTPSCLFKAPQKLTTLIGK